MQQKLSPVVLLTASALAAAVLLSPRATQKLTAFAEDGQAGDYGGALPYVPDGRQVVPGPPIPPQGSSRPASWPANHRAAGPPAYRPEGPFSGGVAPSPNGYFTQYPQPPYAAEVPGAGFAPQEQPAGVPQMEVCEGALIFARVGSEVVLASEVLPAVNEALAPYKDVIPAQQFGLQRRLLIEQQLKIPIETKLIYLDARRSIPKENLPQIEKALGEQFENTELKKLMKTANVETRRELERKLQEMGTSLERRRQTFTQRALAQSWVHQQLKLDEEITYDQMLEYYYQHEAEFARPTRARWEELMARFSNYPSKEAAHAAIVRMGNRVLAGVPLAEVAGSMSDGTTASEGGLRDWTRQGSLVSEELDQALFGLPVGPLSPIVETENGLHIIRVIQREPAHHVPFQEAQAEILPKIREQQSKRQLQAYVARLREQVPVWTIFDEEAEGDQVSGRDAFPRR